jgi:hypothetical protein
MKMGFDESRKNRATLGVDHASCGILWRCLVSRASPGDFSILNYDDRISDRLSAVPVNELSVANNRGADVCFHTGIFVRRKE